MLGEQILGLSIVAAVNAVLRVTKCQPNDRDDRAIDSAIIHMWQDTSTDLIRRSSIVW